MNINCSVDACRKIFIELSLFWRLSLVGFVFLLGLGGSVLIWAQAIYQGDMVKVEKRVNDIEAGLNDISFLRSQSNEILNNQQKILRYFETRRQ